MDYRQKMVVASNRTHMNDDADDDEDDEEALRMAALQSLRAKDTLRTNTQCGTQGVINTQQIAQPCIFYKGQRPVRRTFYPTKVPRQNGGMYFQRHRNPNLIAIVPVEEEVLPQAEPLSKVTETASVNQKEVSDESKFCRYKDNRSGSDDDEDGERRNNLKKTDSEAKEERKATEEGVEVSDVENTSIHEQSPQQSEKDETEEEEEEEEEEDDDVLLMADLEEEDSLERLMDEMEKEMNVDKSTNVIEKKHSRKDKKSSKTEERHRKQKERTKLAPRRTNRSSSPTVPPSSSIPSVLKSEPRLPSPYNSTKPVHRRKSLSPKPRFRKKSPRRSPPRRSPPRQMKKLQRGDGGRDLVRFRSPRRSSPRFSPRLRSPPRLSPRRSPNRSPLRRASPRLSPRLSPRSSPRPRSPRLPRSRSPRISPHPRSPRILRSRSPRTSPRRSPLARLSPRKLSPRTRSPKLSPRLRSPRVSPRTRSPRISPRRMSPRSRTPRASPRVSPRRLSPRARSPRRISPRPRSPGLSPHRSPWSSPRNSPRLSPRRRRSPKELSRKIRPRSVTPSRHHSPVSKRGSTPNSKAKYSPDDFVKSKHKPKEESYEKLTSLDTGRGAENVINDPVLEARRRKFESTKPIDPINANKKIKLSRKVNKEKKSDPVDEIEITRTNLRTAYKADETEYETLETDSYLGVDFEYEELEEPIEDSPAATIASSVNVCSEIEPAKLEREKPVKKKKKKDKELYQVHKSKGELPLSERIGKEKKCKKRKEVPSNEPVEKTETIFEDLTVDEEEGDLRTELSRRRAERLNRTGSIHQQSVRLVQSAFKGVVSEVVKSNAKSIRKQLVKGDDKQNPKEVRRVTVLHRPVSDLHESDDETTTVDSKVPIRFRLGLNKAAQDVRESKASRKNSKRQNRKE